MSTETLAIVPTGTAPGPAERTVTIYSTVGQDAQEVKTSAQTWGELKSQLSGSGISTTGMKVVVGETENNLDSAGASLLPGDFTLFLLPAKVDSGNDEDEDDDFFDEEDSDHAEIKYLGRVDIRTVVSEKESISGLSRNEAITLFDRIMADLGRIGLFLKNTLPPADEKLKIYHDRAKEIADRIRNNR